MITSILFWLPFAMVTAGTIWLAIREVREGDEATETSNKTLAMAEKSLAILADREARDGNEKMRAELIDTRTKLALAGAQGSSKTIRSIISQLPQLTENQKKLNQEKQNSVKATMIDFELCWTPTIKLAVSKFYSRVEEMKANGIEFHHVNKPSELPPLTTDGDRNMRFRVGEIGDKNLKSYIIIEYTPGAISPYGMTRAVLAFDTLSQAGLDTRFSMEMDFNDITTQFGTEPKPADGMPTEAIIKKIDEGFAKAIERFLVISAVEK